MTKTEKIQILYFSNDSDVCQSVWREDAQLIPGEGEKVNEESIIDGSYLKDLCSHAEGLGMCVNHQCYSLEGETLENYNPFLEDCKSGKYLDKDIWNVWKCRSGREEGLENLVQVITVSGSIGDFFKTAKDYISNQGCLIATILAWKCSKYCCRGVAEKGDHYFHVVSVGSFVRHNVPCILKRLSESSISLDKNMSLYHRTVGPGNAVPLNPCFWLHIGFKLDLVSKYGA